MIPTEQLTGVLLAGGRGARMGGLDKGLQPFGGTTLAAHALARLRPQVGPLLISANRNLDRYRTFGVPVLCDAVPEFAGPLAGILAALRAAQTPYLACAPCDAPFFPIDFVAQLANALSDNNADIATAVTPLPEDEPRRHPVFAVMRVSLADDLANWLADGGRKAHTWYMRHKTCEVAFADEHAFYNVNTLQALSDIDNP